MAMAWSPLGTYYSKKGEQTARISKCLEGLSEKYQATENQLLLAWLLRHPAGIYPVVGTTRAERLEESREALDIEMDLPDWFSMLVASQGKDVP
jgi:predicted oxidoreductase